MSSLLEPAPGFLAVSFVDADGRDLVDVERAVRRVTDELPQWASSRRMITASWGVLPSAARNQAMVLALAPRRGERPLSVDDVSDMLRLRDGVALRETLPTFAAVLADEEDPLSRSPTH